MEDIVTFDVNGKDVEVPRSRLEEFNNEANEHNAAIDQLHTVRVTRDNGKAEDVEVPESHMDAFRSEANEHGATLEPVRTIGMNDGTTRTMTIGELSKFLRSKEYLKSDDHSQIVSKAEQDGLTKESETLAGFRGAIGGFFSGAYAGASATANKIARAIPETAIEIESAAGNLMQGAAKYGKQMIGDNVVTQALGGLGEAAVANAAEARAWLDMNIPTEASNWSGYDDWATKVADFIGNTSAMAYKFAPAMATKTGEIAASGLRASQEVGANIVPEAAEKGFGGLMETIFASDGINAYAQAYDAAKERGASELDAVKIGGEAFLLNYFGGKAMMRAGGIAEGVENPVLKFLAGGAAVSDVMGLQAAGNQGVMNEAEGKPITEGMGTAFSEGVAEGWAFHGLNAVPGMVMQGFANREAKQRYMQMVRREILEEIKTPQGAAMLSVMMNGEALNEAIRARKSGAEDVLKLAQAAGLPETMSKYEVNETLDAISRQRDAMAERNRLRMDDVQAQALSETVADLVEKKSAELGLDEKGKEDMFARTWLKATEKVTNAADMDDPDLRQKIVDNAGREIGVEIKQEKEEARAENSRLRGASAAEQIAEIESRNITSWEDAEADGLIGKDDRGRWSGGMRAALNVAINGTDEMKTAVKSGGLEIDVAENMLTASYCELGGRPPEERNALIDKILDFADGNSEVAKRVMDKIARREGGNDTPLLEDLPRIEDEVTREMASGEAVNITEGRAPETAYEGALNWNRMKGTELRSEDGGLMRCERFPEVTVRIDQAGILVEGLTDELMSRPENAADTAALLKRLSDIAERNGLMVDLGDANAKTVADGIMDEINRGGLEATQRKMDTRAKLFDVLSRTTLGNGVTFDEGSFREALEKTANGRQFTDNHGNVYGFVDGDGVLHFNPTAINYNTPIHEYGHLALEAVKKVNGNLWQRGMDLVKDSDYYRELSEEARKDASSPYANFDENGLRDEALARMIGDRGEKLVTDKGLEAKLKQWLKEFWAAFKGALGVADLTDEQIEKMTLGDFVEAINAELLRGKEFGTRKAATLKAKSIRRFDEDNASGSNGLLRWKTARGHLFKLPVDMERTQPGGKIVLKGDDANVTDWISNALNGYDLRLSKTGKVYVKGHDGLTGELAEIFGRYPTIGENDGIYDQIASETGHRAATPSALVEALRADRERYDAWRRATEEGRSLEDIEQERHYAELEQREAAEAESRWENSGMNVMDYIRSRVEEGDPEFDLDWETAREIERDRAAGRFAIGASDYISWNQILDRYESGDIKQGEHLTVWKNTPAVLKALGVPDLPIRVDKSILDKITGKVPTSHNEWHAIPAAELRNLQIELDNPIAVFDSKSNNNSLVVLTRMIDRQNNEKAVVALRINVAQGNIDVNAITSAYGKDKSSIENWTAWRLLRYVNKQARKSSARWFQLPSDSDLRARSVLTEKDFSNEQLGRIVPQSGDAVNGLAKMSYSQPSLFDQVYQQTFDFNRKAEQPKQQKLDLSSDNAKPLIRTDKIEDVGEKISGARKDILKNYVAAIDDATREQLYALPFSKAFKRPDLVKAVQNGTMREKDANFYETILSTIVQKKPILTAKDARMKKYRPDYETNLDKWVDNTQNALSILKQFLGLDEAGRDQFIRTVLENKHINVAADQQQIEDIQRYNSGSDFLKTGECYTPNPIYVASEVLKRIGHKTGDKVDIPFAIKPNTLFDSYNVVDAKGDSYYKLKAKDLESAIDNLAYLTKLKRGDTDIEHPDAAFTISPDRSIIAENGQYRVYWGKGSGVENQRDFASKEQAEEFAKTKDASLHPMTYPVKSVVGKTDYSVKFVNNITGEVSRLGDKVFKTREEAQRYLDENREDVNDMANAELAKKAGKPKSEMTADKLVQVGYSSRSENHWVVFEQDKDEQTIIRSFKTRDEAKKYRDEIKADYLEQWKKNKEDRKKFVYFDTGDEKRVGEDYRDGKDVKAEDFMNEFGFRGVQFGNWTNQADRQMAVNQAYDAFMDLSKLIGIPPRALSLNGELGIAFGARGSGSALAHYEPSEVVINLTKTKGAGSLAHEWWHALDNYFARAAGSKGGMVTDSEWLKMRSELREAFNAFTRNMKGSNYGIRSARQGAYWGRMHEITARFLAEWVDQSLKKQGRLNTFLSRGANEEGWLEMNYDLYRQQMQAAKTEPVSIEEFEKNPKAYNGFPYPTKKEVAEFGENVRRIFDTIKVREEGEGANTTYALFSTARPNVNVAANRNLVNKSLFVAGRARVAHDAGMGEQTPGALAASRELSSQGTTPLSQLGSVRRMSLPLSEMEWLRKTLTGNVLPSGVAKSIPGGKYAGHTKDGRLYISADIFGTVDKTDMAHEKELLKQHGFFQDEDMTWRSNHTDYEIKAERRRSEDQLATQLEQLGSRRARGTEAGGSEAARGVFADEVAQIVMDLPQTGGAIGRIQTIGRGLRDAVKNTFGGDETAMRAEAGNFLDSAYGGPLVDPSTGNPISRGESKTLSELTNAMFGKWMIMPEAMTQSAPNWSRVIESTIANDAKLSTAFREMTLHMASEQGTSYLMERLNRQQSRTTEAALKKLREDANEPIGTGSMITDAKETLLVGFHDKFAPVYIRVDEKAKEYVRAKKAAMRLAGSAADRDALRQEIELFQGDLSTKMNRLELSRNAYERGAANEGRRYFLEMTLLENKATAKWGLGESDKSQYLYLQRVIETQGRAAADGMTARQAQIGLDEMQNRLGPAKFAKLEQYAQEFFSIHEREILNDPRIERALGKAYVDYCRTQTHYVTTKRTFTVEELDAINTARQAAQRSGVAGGDDVVSQMYAFAGARGAGSVVGEGVWTSRLKGSMAAVQEVRSATWEKVDPLMQFGRRNQMVLDLRDALVAAKVEGVHDMVRTDGAAFPDGKRYGQISYMENGEKRVLIVPRQIADAFKVDPDAAQWLTKANSLIRSALIDYNVAYGPQNVKRNQDSLEKNMPGMRETYLKTALRAVAPGAAPITDLVLQAIVRKVPAAGHLFGEHTVLAHIPKAERYAAIIENPTKWQQELWDAENAGNLDKANRMRNDFDGVMEMLKGNMFTSISKAYSIDGESAGFAFDALNGKGMKTLAQLHEESAKRTPMQKFVQKINVFKMNQAQQEHEEILAKVVGYLHDRKFYAMQRSVAESGDVVKKNVSIAEGERAGKMKRPLQWGVAQFFNMVEKGVVRHWKAIKDRPGEMLAKDGKVWMGRLIGQLFAGGAMSAWMLNDSDGDEEKAAQKYGMVFRYANAFHRAWQNCSDYVKENYNITPVWTSPDGMTSVIIGGAMTDEDKLICPTADFVAGHISNRLGVGQEPSVGKAFANATVKAITPDMQLAGPMMTIFRDTIESMLWNNPTDYFRNAPTYDPKLWEARNESWEMRGKFAAAVGERLFSDIGGRAFIAPDIYGVDNGRGSAPETLQAVLKSIPVVSPAIARMVKIQVGSPSKMGETITAQQKKIKNIIEICAEDLLKRGTDDVGYHERNPQGFAEQIDTWRQRYGLSDENVATLQSKYFNAFIQRKNREGYDRVELSKLFAEGRKQGLTDAQIWIMLGER